MTLVLRDYQIAAIQAGIGFLTQKKKRNGLMVIPCGGGKSLIAAGIIEGLNAPAILFQPRKELVIQNRDKLINLYGIHPAIYSASMKEKRVGEVTLATIQSVMDYPYYFEDVRYVLVDEASDVNPKKGMYRDFLAGLSPEVRILGLDAIPIRMASDAFGTQLKFLTRTKPRVFEDVVYWVQLKDLFDQGHLCKLEYFSMQKEIALDVDELEINNSGSDYTDESVQLHLFKIGFAEKLADIVRRLLAKNRTGILIFTRFTKEAEYLASQIPEVAVVTTHTSDDERERVLREFKAGRIKAVANVGIISIGFDYPALDTVVLGHLTMSLRLFYQWIGRVIRPDPSKRSAWVIDLMGNLQRFGRLEDLQLYCEGNSRWSFWGRPAGGPEKQLTNCYLIGGVKGLCPRCHVPKIMAFYEKKGKWLPLSKPPAGSRANVVVEQQEKKKVCRIDKDDPKAAWVLHIGYVCDRFKAMREAA